jgi:hypothetical protein
MGVPGSFAPPPTAPPPPAAAPSFAPPPSAFAATPPVSTPPPGTHNASSTMAFSGAPLATPGSGPVPYPQQGSGPTTQPTSAPHPMVQQPTGPTQPYPGSAGSGGVPYPAPPTNSAPFTGTPAMTPSANAGPAWTGGTAPAPASPPSPLYSGTGDTPGQRFVSFLKISGRRAFRLRIEPSEVLADEREALLRASPPIHDPNLQAFLAWRRSVLFLVACALVPLTVIGVIDALRNTQYNAIFFVKGMPAFAEGLFCWICWAQLKQWMNWRTQRRRLFLGWLLFMLTPFIVFIYPLNSFFSELRAGQLKEAVGSMGIDGAAAILKRSVLPFVFAMIAMLQLAPKAISLMPGLIRASMVIKLLFPGSSAPGWLIVMAAPLYALLAYVILIIPYQFTGSGWFIAGVLGVVAGQAVLARAGFQLARPQSEEEALKQIKKVRRYYITVMITSAVLIVVALGSLVSKLNLAATDVILAVLKFESNVLILTMIGADLVVTNLDKARHYTHGHDHVEHATEHKIAAFVSFEQPPPPPPGPAH